MGAAPCLRHVDCIRVNARGHPAEPCVPGASVPGSCEISVPRTPRGTRCVFLRPVPPEAVRTRRPLAIQRLVEVVLTLLVILSLTTYTWPIWSSWTPGDTLRRWASAAKPVISVGEPTPRVNWRHRVFFRQVPTSFWRLPDAS